MHDAQIPYWQLWRDIGAPATRELEPVLTRWLERHGPEEQRWLDAIRDCGPDDPMPAHDLWRLYALSRVSDVLITATRPIQPREPAEPGPRLSVERYQRFMTSLGLSALRVAAFHPFFHEIVTVAQQDDPDALPVIVREEWPCLTLGRLLFVRAGCAIASGVRHVDPHVAERSTLYWAHARGDRRVSDLSVGWGQMSQWRTAFRRDYFGDGLLRYNVDAPAQRDRGVDDDGTTDEERLELLRHRCFVTYRNENEQWPWDLRHAERAPR